jgi:hypothetical protein
MILCLLRVNWRSRASWYRIRAHRNATMAVLASHLTDALRHAAQGPPHHAIGACSVATESHEALVCFVILPTVACPAMLL